MSVERRKDEEVVVHLNSGILVIKRNECESVEVRWMNLELVIQSEISQKEKSRYQILTHGYGTDDPVCRAGTEKQMWRIDLT